MHTTLELSCWFWRREETGENPHSKAEHNTSNKLNSHVVSAENTRSFPVLNSPSEQILYERVMWRWSFHAQAFWLDEQLFCAVWLIERFRQSHPASSSVAFFPNTFLCSLEDQIGNKPLALSVILVKYGVYLFIYLLPNFKPWDWGSHWINASPVYRVWSFLMFLV
jgi:hypothetical protein